MASNRNRKANEWELLKDEFDALVHNEGAHEEIFDSLLDYEVHRRFGELIAGPTWYNPTYSAKR